MNIKTLSFCSRFGVHELAIAVGRYADNGRLAIDLVCYDDGYPEPYARLTKTQRKAPAFRPGDISCAGFFG